MSQSILQSFLNEHIIDIDQNEDFSNLTKSASELEKRLRNKKARIIQASLIAFDPHVDPTEPFLQEVQDIVVSKWRAFPSKCQDRPVPYLRAVILAALQGLQNELALSGIVWLTVSNYLIYVKANDREAKILSNFLAEFGNQFEQSGWKLWDVNAKYEIPSFPKIEKEAIGSVNPIKLNYAKDNLEAALGKSENAKNEEQFFSFRENYGGNTHIVRPSEKWITSFSSIAGNAIQAIAIHIIDNFNKLIEQLVSVKYIEIYTNQLVNYLGKTVDVLHKHSNNQNLRSQLLWIKESKYSVSQQQSYRDLPVSIVPVAVAIDLKDSVPTVYPISIDYFLKEIIIDVNSKSKELAAFGSILENFVANKNFFAQVVYTPNQSEIGRINLLSFVRELIAGKVSVEDFEASTGLKLTDAISEATVGIWLFREFQAEKIATAK